MGIVFTQHGDFNNTERMLLHMKKFQISNILKKYGERGVAALSAATPVDTGKTAESWDYVVEQSRTGWSVSWTNSNTNRGISIALLLQFGHGTGTGGYVKGIDYINPALSPIFDEMAREAWLEVTRV